MDGDHFDKINSGFSTSLSCKRALYVQILFNAVTLTEILVGFVPDKCSDRLFISSVVNHFFQTFSLIAVYL